MREREGREKERMRNCSLLTLFLFVISDEPVVVASVRVPDDVVQGNQPLEKQLNMCFKIDSGFYFSKISKLRLWLEFPRKWEYLDGRICVLEI